MFRREGGAARRQYGLPRDAAATREAHSFSCLFVSFVVLFFYVAAWMEKEDEPRNSRRDHERDLECFAVKEELRDAANTACRGTRQLQEKPHSFSCLFVSFVVLLNLSFSRPIIRQRLRLLQRQRNCLLTSLRRILILPQKLPDQNPHLRPHTFPELPIHRRAVPLLLGYAAVESERSQFH